MLKKPFTDLYVVFASLVSGKLHLQLRIFWPGNKKNVDQFGSFL